MISTIPSDQKIIISHCYFSENEIAAIASRKAPQTRLHFYGGSIAISIVQHMLIIHDVVIHDSKINAEQQGVDPSSFGGKFDCTISSPHPYHITNGGAGIIQ
jgi:D-alanyl-D-alanine dipeptidase